MSSQYSSLTDFPSDLLSHIIHVTSDYISANDLLSLMFTCKRSYQLISNAKAAWSNVRNRLLAHLRGRFVPGSALLKATLEAMNNPELSKQVPKIEAEAYEDLPVECSNLLRIQKNWSEGNYSLVSSDLHHAKGTGLYKLGTLCYVGVGDGRMTVLEMSQDKYNAWSFKKIKVSL